MASSLERSRRVTALVSAVLASLVGVVAMLLFWGGLLSSTRSLPFLYPLEVIGSLLVGAPSPRPLPASGYLAALALLLLSGALWGVVYGMAALYLRVERQRGAALGLGVVIGLLSQLVDVTLLTPSLLGALHGHDLWATAMPRPVSWAGHVVFGMGFSAYPAIFRRLRRSGSRRAELDWDDPRIQ